MTENRRIALNVAATYGRSLYALVIGLFCGRWTLMALGETDYGLMGVVGGLMAFVTFLNGLMSQSVSRFYAFSVGRARTAATVEEGVEECRRWFSVAVLIHTVLPTLLVAVGYPVGVWAIEHFLTIPPDRVGDCLWVWRFTCLSGFVAMVNVPFAAMYNAKQEIAELTLYSFVTTTFNFCFVYYMVTHPGVWLAKYALLVCLLSVVPELLIGARAIMKYPECRFRRDAVRDGGRMSQLFAFAGSRAVNAFSSLLSGNGMAIVVNKYLGPAKNAAMSIGNMVSGHASSLSNSLVGAFSPAITNAAGEGDLVKMRHFVFCACRFSTAAVMVFAIPLALEVDAVMRLWLKNPPDGVTVIVPFLLIDMVVARISDGHWIAIFALGRIFRFQICESICFFLRFLIAWMLVLFGFDLLGVGIAYLLTGIGTILVKLWYGRTLCGLSVREWTCTVFLPLAAAAAVCIGIGFLPRLFLQETFGRILLTTGIVELTLLPLIWHFAFTEEERAVVRGKFDMGVMCKWLKR